MKILERMSFALLLLVFLFCSCTHRVDPEIEKEIKALETDYYSIVQIKGNFGHFFVHIMYNSEPLEVQPDSAGMEVCDQVVDILKAHSIKKRVGVTVWSPDKKDGKHVRPYVYGYVRYKESKAKYEWKQVREN